MIDVDSNHRLLHIESKSFMLSIIRFYENAKKKLAQTQALEFDHFIHFMLVGGK